MPDFITDIDKYLDDLVHGRASHHLGAGGESVGPSPDDRSPSVDDLPPKVDGRAAGDKTSQEPTS